MDDKLARTHVPHLSVYTFAFVAMLVMQSELSWLPVAISVPFGEIAHAHT